jgi:hypothetical protein
MGDKFAGNGLQRNSVDVGGTVFVRGIISARLGGLLMRDRDTIDSELRLVTALRRSTRRHHRPRPVDAPLNDLIDELLEERQRVSRISKHVATQRTSGRSVGNGHREAAARRSQLRTRAAPRSSGGGPFEAGPTHAIREQGATLPRRSFRNQTNLRLLPSQHDGPCDQRCSTGTDPAALIDGRFANFLK